MVLKDVIIEKIRREGPITFHDYMDMCLYYPDLGYYTGAGAKIGAEGDFYTSSSLTSSFGAIIARQMEEMWLHLGKADFTIVEYGAGLGALCQDILDELSGNTALYSRLRYCIIEKSAVMRQNEQRKLKGNDKVVWYSCIGDIPGDINCVFSNELFDNFAVHQVVMEQQLMEIFVDYQEKFIEIVKPASRELNRYFKELGVNLPKGYRTEVNFGALNWINEIAGCIKTGYIITIDYGDVSERLYKSSRKTGTVVCYNNHKISQDPFCDIGEQDITAHINFSALDSWGRKAGLSTCGITYQAYFLASLGFREHIRETNRKKGRGLMQIVKDEAFISHTLLFDMGQKYKVLIQSKGMPETQLTGLQFAITKKKQYE